MNALSWILDGRGWGSGKKSELPPTHADYIRGRTRCPVPECDSKHCPAYKTERYDPKAQTRIRYHKCEDCGWNFKSIERKTPENEI